MAPTPVSVPNWCRKLPKIELHAHLSGSIRKPFLRRQLHKLVDAETRLRAEKALHFNSDLTLRPCFELFTVIHDLIPDTETLRAAVLSVLRDFADDNVVYLELRTTPRKTKQMTAEQYLHTVLAAVLEYHQNEPQGLVCRVLVSVARHLSVQWAWDTLRLTEHILNSAPKEIRSLIVGVELSGNPLRGQWKDFQAVFEDARKRLGLLVTLHFAEVFNDEEALSMLQFNPDRIGHAVQMSPVVTSRLLAQEPKIGVEVCITSNLATESIAHVENHPVFTELIPSRHPFCLCTDDVGVFNSSLSEEYARFVTTAGLSEETTRHLSQNALNLIFCRENDVIEHLRLKLV